MVNGILSGNPQAANVGTVNLTITAIDLFGANASLNVPLIVGQTSSYLPPQVNLPIVSSTKPAGKIFILSVASAFFDSSRNALTLSASLADGSPLPSFLTFNPSAALFIGDLQVSDVEMGTVSCNSREHLGAFDTRS